MADQVTGREAVKALPCWPRVLDMLKAGTSTTAIAKWLQGDQMVLTDWKQETLERNLVRLRREMGIQVGKTPPEQKLKPTVDPEPPDAKGKAPTGPLPEDTPQIKERIAQLHEIIEMRTTRKKLISVMDELQSLLELTMTRILWARELEIRVGYVLTSLGDLTTEARQLLKDLFQVQEKLGMLRRTKPEEEVQGNKAKPDELPFESRKKVTRIVDLLRARITTQQEVSEARILDAVDAVVQEGRATEELPFEEEKRGAEEG